MTINHLIKFVPKQTNLRDMRREHAFWLSNLLAVVLSKDTLLILHSGTAL